MAVETAKTKNVRLSSVIVGFASANLLVTILSMFGAILQARFATPLELGMFKGYGLAVSYLTFLHLGTFDGLHRELPFHIGKGDRAKAVSMAAVVQGWILFVCIICSTVFLALAIWSAIHLNWLSCAAWITQIMNIFSVLYVAYLNATYRTNHDFIHLSKANLAASIISLAMVFTIKYWGFYGICARFIVSSALALYLLHRLRPFKVKSVIDWGLMRSILAIGAPIFAVGYLQTSLWVTVDATIVLRLLGVKALGLYSVVTFMSVALCVIPQAVNQVCQPRVTELFGRNGSVRDCLKISLKPTVLTTAGMVTLSIVFWFLIGFIVKLILPKYVAAIPALQWSAILAAVLALHIPFYIFMAARRVSYYGVSVVVGIMAYAIVLLCVGRNNLSLVTFVQAMIVGRLFQAIVSYSLLYKMIRLEQHNLNIVNEISES